MPDDLFSECSPVLPVDNAEETTRFYKDALGFETSHTYGQPPFYVVVKRGSVHIHFSEREDTTFEIEPCHVFIRVSDVDAVYEEFMSKGLEIEVPPEDQDYGMREFDLLDPNGHFLTFGQEIERS
jgi:uncharacterized glyoxalase superfamily protein PhnB